MISARIPSLDGLRALAIALVLLMHAGQTHGFPAWNIRTSVGDVGHLGVTLFFVISGYLITTLLINEFDAAGRISLRRFYWHRSLRILPAAYVYLLALALAAGVGWIDVSGNDFLASIAYLVNYDAHRSWYVGHLWSLGVEEQFYLLWPMLFIWQGRKRALVVAVITFFGAPVVRTAMRFFIAPGPYRDLEIFPAVADAMAVGCALAILRPWLLVQSWYLRLTASPAMWLLPVLVIGINRWDGYTVVDLFGSPIQLFSIAALIETSTRHAGTIVGRILNSTPAVYVGTLSYSLYLWQQPFLDRHRDNWLAAFPLNLVIALGMAMISYYLVERPFLRMRRHGAGDARVSADSPPPVHED